MSSSPPALPLMIMAIMLLLLATHSCTATAASGHSPGAPAAGGHRKRRLPGSWNKGHATFYDGYRSGGGCGYTDTHAHGYGDMTAAVSNTLFGGAKACGSCYEIRCVNDPQWCIPGGATISVTATDSCPPNFALANDNGGWCNPPLSHFDLAVPAFVRLAEYKAGIVPIEYRRVSCKKEGGIRFKMSGSKWFTMVLVWNVAGAGDVASVLVKADRGRDGQRRVPWTALSRNWGSNWQTSEDLTGKSLTFRIVASDGRKSTSWHVAPTGWQFEQTYEGRNFRS